MRNHQIKQLCPFKKSPAVIVSVQPAKFIPQKPKRNNRPAPFMRPGIVKSPNKAKRNREFRQSPNFPYLCGVFLPHRIAHIGILTATPGFIRAWFSLISKSKRTPQYRFPDSFATIWYCGHRNAGFSGRFANGKVYFAGIIANYPLSLFMRPAFNTGTRIDVLFWRYPFQVFNPVVGLTFVFVVNLRQPVRIRDKSDCNQPIDADFLAFSIFA